MIDPAWAGVILSSSISLATGAAVFAKIAYGQGVAKTRELQHTEDLQDIKQTLIVMTTDESACKLNFEHRISKVEQRTESLQNEVTEEKHNRKGV